MTVAEFRAYYETHHRVIGEKYLSGFASRYMRRFITPSPEPGDRRGAGGGFRRGAGDLVSGPRHLRGLWPGARPPRRRWRKSSPTRSASSTDPRCASSSSRRNANPNFPMCAEVQSMIFSPRHFEDTRPWHGLPGFQSRARCPRSGCSPLERGRPALDASNVRSLRAFTIGARAPRPRRFQRAFAPGVHHWSEGAPPSTLPTCVRSGRSPLERGRPALGASNVRSLRVFTIGARAPRPRRFQRAFKRIPAWMSIEATRFHPPFKELIP